PRPLTFPVSNRQDRTLVAGESSQHVVRVLPHRFGHNDLCIGIDSRKCVHALALGSEEAMSEIGLVRVATAHRVAEFGQRSGELLFHGLLGRPALDVRAFAQIATGEQDDFFRAHLIVAPYYSTDAMMAA